MRASANNKRLWLAALLAWLLPAMSLAGDTERFGVQVKNVEIKLQDGNYLLSADVDYRLSPRAQEALENGIPLFWTINIKTMRQRDYLWDEMLADAGIRYRIQYHALLNMYRVRKENGGEIYNFSTLSAALDAMSAVRDFRVMDKLSYQPEQRYAVGIKVTLDRDALPLPLRPIAYINPQWYLASDWTICPLAK